MGTEPDLGPPAENVATPEHPCRNPFSTGSIGMGRDPATKLEMVDCGGFTAAILHSVLQAVGRLGPGTWPRGPDNPTDHAQFRPRANSGELV